MSEPIDWNDPALAFAFDAIVKANAARDAYYGKVVALLERKYPERPGERARAMRVPMVLVREAR